MSLLCSDRWLERSPNTRRPLWCAAVNVDLGVSYLRVSGCSAFEHWPSVSLPWARSLRPVG